MCFFFFFPGNAFVCDCGLLWMNRLAEETVNDQVSSALSDVQCRMNDTSDEVDGGPGGSSGAARPDKMTIADGAGPRRVPGASSAGGDERAGSADANGEPKLTAGESPSSSDASNRPHDDESRLVRVSAMDDDTCPGKERPVVDGAPDAAQNSDRILQESSNKSSAVARAAALCRPFLLAALVLARRC